MVLGFGKYKYEPMEGWLKLPEYFSLDEHPGSMSIWDIACDSQDRVYLFAPGNHPLIVLDRDSNFISCWGEGRFVNPHGVFIGPDDSIFLNDRQAHVIEKYTLDGKLLMTLGKRGWSQPIISAKPFNLPACVAVGPSGDIFVADGYGNNLIHKFSQEGDLIKSWGGAGTDLGQFSVPHSVAVDRHRTVYVCDRQNHRIQTFTSDGEFISLWDDFKYPEDMYIDQKRDIIYIVEGHNTKSVRPRLSIRDLKGNILSEWGGRKSQGEGVMNSPHGIWVDSRGDIYVADPEPNAYRILKFIRTQ